MRVSVDGGGGGYTPYLGYTGTCRWTGYEFGLAVLNRVYNFIRLCPKQR